MKIVKFSPQVHPLTISTRLRSTNKIVRADTSEFILANKSTSMKKLTSMILSYYDHILKNGIKQQRKVPAVKERLFDTKMINNYNFKQNVLERKDIYTYRECFDSDKNEPLSAKYYTKNVKLPNSLMAAELFYNENTILSEIDFRFLPYLRQSFEDKDRGVLIIDDYSQLRLYDLKGSAALSSFKNAVRQLVISICYRY